MKTIHRMLGFQRVDNYPHQLDWSEADAQEQDFTSIAARPLWKRTPYNAYGYNEAILAQQKRFLDHERSKDLFPETVYPVIQGRPDQPDDFFEPPVAADEDQLRLF